MNVEICSDLGVAILAGGRSSRFGTDKALYRIRPDGPTMLEAVIAIASKLSPEVVIVGHQRYARVAGGVSILSEDSPGHGPLPAIEAALASTSMPRVLVLGCDMPCLSVQLLSWMARQHTYADAIVPQTLDGRWHPLHAIYRTTCLPSIRVSIQRNRYAASSFYGEISIETLTEQIMRKFDPDLDSLFSLNAVDDLPRVRLCETRR